MNSRVGIALFFRLIILVLLVAGFARIVNETER